MTSNTDFSNTSTMLSDEETVQQLGLKYHLKHTEVKHLIDYYKRKDPNNKGLLPHQINPAAGHSVASGLTVDPTIIFNIFNSTKSGTRSRVTIREFVLGYAILSRGTNDSRLRYLFSLFGATHKGSTGSTLLDGPSANPSDHHLTRDQLIRCLKFLQRVVSEVSESNSDSDSNDSDDNEEKVHTVADKLIAETANPNSHHISYNDFIAQLKESDEVTSMLDKLSNAAGEHLKYIDRLEHDVAELHMEREGILNSSTSSIQRSSPGFSQEMEWSPAPSSSKQSSSSKLNSAASHDNSSNPRLVPLHVEKKRKIPMPRKQKVVRRDLGLRRSSSDQENNNLTKRPSSSKGLPRQVQQQLQRNEDLQQTQKLNSPELHAHSNSNSRSNSISNSNSSSGLHSEPVDDLDDDVDEINAAKPFLINHEQIEFGKILGRGACATVYEGKWMHIPVAVKVFNDGAGEAAGIERLATNDEEKRRTIVGDYVEEFWLLLQIRHPNCLLYMGICFEPYVCIVTELFTGGSIANFLHGPHAQKFSPSKAVEMISGVASGMFYLHASSPPILHRDLKSSNILINRHTTHCVICDFGLSKQFVNEASGRDVSASDNEHSRRREREEPGIIGTPYTMAPEVIEQDDYTPAADVYSFAIVMYEMFTGRYPFPKMKPIQLMFHVAQGKRPQFQESDCIPPLLRELIENCWAQNPKDRPNFESILNMLQSKEMEEEVKKADRKWKSSHGKSDAVKGKDESDSKELTKSLLEVAYRGNNEELLGLINRGADVNYHDYDKRTALHVASAEGHVECMRTLVRAGAVLSRDRWDNTPIADAMLFADKTGSSEGVRLMRAVESNQKSLDAVSESKDFEGQDDIYRTYAALNAAQNGDLKKLVHLLNSGLDVNSCDYDRRTPLMVSASEGQSEVVKTLLAYGANVTKRDRWGNTAYHEAQRRGYHDVMRSIQQKDGDGKKSMPSFPPLPGRPRTSN